MPLNLLCLFLCILPGGLYAKGASVKISDFATTNALSIDIHQRVKGLAGLKYDHKNFQEQLQDGCLAILYTQLSDQQKYLISLKAFASNPSTIEAAQENLKRQKTAIQSFYVQYAKQPLLGDTQALTAPHAIIILGANRTTLTQRLKRALPIIQKFSDAPVVLSGGGRSIEEEAAFMHEYLRKHGILDERLIIEADSLDTVGNAVFSRLILERRKIHGGNILLVTSDFHAPRSLFLFKNILGSAFRVAVASTPYESPNALALADKELIQQANTMQSLLRWGTIENASPPVKETCDVFFQMLLQHNLYRSRWDLARNYQDTCRL